MSTKSKAYKAAAELVDKSRLYRPIEATKLAKETSSKNFDATVDVVFRLGVDPRKADQLVRGTVSLPNGTGKDVRALSSLRARRLPPLRKLALTSLAPLN